MREWLKRLLDDGREAERNRVETLNARVLEMTNDLRSLRTSLAQKEADSLAVELRRESNAREREAAAEAAEQELRRKEVHASCLWRCGGTLLARVGRLDDAYLLPDRVRIEEGTGWIVKCAGCGGEFGIGNGRAFHMPWVNAPTGRSGTGTPPPRGPAGNSGPPVDSLPDADFRQPIDA